MEHALGETGIVYYTLEGDNVLILIVMEHALGVDVYCLHDATPRSLNPYCNGTCSRSRCYFHEFGGSQRVLILIVMEHALGAKVKRLHQLSKITS